MRTLTLFIACSLDGYIARADGGIDWLYQDQDYGYNAFYAGIDTVLMGRKTYELARSFPEYPYPGKRAIVFTRTARAPDEHAEFVSQGLGERVAGLKRASGQGLWLVGGGEIVAECLRHDLIDAFEIFVHPVLLGAGIPLFPAGVPERALEALRTHRFDSGLVQLSLARRGVAP